MFATLTKMMQLLLFYCIIIQSCVLRDVKSIPTPTESSAESVIPGERVGRSSGDSETTDTSFLGYVLWLFKRFTSIVSHIPTMECMEQTGNLLNHIHRGERDTTNKQTVADIELNRNAHNRVFRATDKRDWRQLKKAIQPMIDVLDDLLFSKTSVIPLLIPKFDSRVKRHTGPKQIKVVFENDESTMRNKSWDTVSKLDVRVG